MKKLLKSLTVLVAVTLVILPCCLFSACSGQTANLCPEYAGTYRFNELKIYQSTNNGDNWALCESEAALTAAFAELAAHFTQEEILAEAEKQYFAYNADGTVVWHLPTYLGSAAAPAATVNGTWSVQTTRTGERFVIGNYTGGLTNYGVDDIVSKPVIERPLSLYSNFTQNVEYQFVGQREVTEDGETFWSTTDTLWQIYAVYVRG